MIKSGKWNGTCKGLSMLGFPVSSFFPRVFWPRAICASCPTRFNSTEPGDVPVALGGSAISTWKMFFFWQLPGTPSVLFFKATGNP